MKNNFKFLFLLVLPTLLTGCNFEFNPGFFGNSENKNSLSDIVSEENSVEISEASVNHEYEIIDSEGNVTYRTDYYDNYYGSLTSWENGEDLKKKLHDLISNGKVDLEYEGNWESCQAADQALDDFECVDVVYSSTNLLKTQTSGSTSNITWDREHAFCASLMTGTVTGSAVKTLGRATDFHNLFASLSSENRSRGNKNYGLKDENEANYEPLDEDKGRLSRAILYMCTFYDSEVMDAKNEVLMGPLHLEENYVNYESGNCQFAMGNKNTLISWATDFDVDRLEYQHNESIYSTLIGKKTQGNRNPYVDYPEFVDYVFGSKSNEPGELKNLKPSCVALDTLSSKINNYAIKTAKRVYKVGEAISPNDIEVVAVKKNFELGDEYISKRIEAHIFDKEDIGTKEITIGTDINEIKYNVEVIDGELESCAYFYEAKTDELGTQIKAKETTTVTLNGIDWNIKTASENDVRIANNNGNGVQIGTKSAPCVELTLESKETFSFNSMTNIKKIFVKATTASGKKATITISVGKTKIVDNEQLGWDSNGIILGNNDLNLSGKVSIKISGIDSFTVRLMSIGIHVE